ncbi:oligosaccharide flippase family protein [Mumia sp. ZJ1417]|uniref:oligosaccharide flippase family protein n=1 Tax=Mumia sp. ZJ1417 TaxID=2708082 RepID=UPI0014202C58|nr:oligosaccharide flippase family protein [Mumia sp. ZJ1417]QMW66876.1 oligosaccharide flippase family protein [Mumia sp. ZJ1417]
MSRPGSELLRASARLTLPTVLAVGLGAVTAIVTARSLGPTGRGQLVLALTVVTISSVVLTLGLDTAARFALVRAETGVTAGAYLGASLILVVVETVVVAAVLVATGKWGDVQFSRDLVLLSSAFAAVFHSAAMLRGLLSAYGHLLVTACASAGGVVLTFVLVCGFALRDSGAVDVYLIAFGLGALLELVVLGAYGAARGLLRAPAFALSSWRTLVRLGIPALGIVGARTVVFRLDRYVVGVVMGAGAAGVYSIASTVSEALRFAPRILSEVVLHRVATRRGSTVAVEHARLVLVVVTAPILIVIAVFAPQIITLLVGPEFLDAVLPLRILLIGELAVVSFWVDLNHLAGMGRFGRASVMCLAVAAAVVALDLWLIPTLGLAGAAIASVAGYLGFAVAARAGKRSASREDEPDDRRVSGGPA